MSHREQSWDNKVKGEDHPVERMAVMIFELQGRLRRGVLGDTAVDTLVMIGDALMCTTFNGRSEGAGIC